MRYRQLGRRGGEYERQLGQALLEGQAIIEEVRYEPEWYDGGRYDRERPPEYTFTVRMRGMLDRVSPEERDEIEIEARNLNAEMMRASLTVADVDRVDYRPALDRFVAMVKVVVRAWATDSTTIRYGNLDL